MDRHGVLSRDYTRALPSLYMSSMSLGLTTDIEGSSGGVWSILASGPGQALILLRSPPRCPLCYLSSGYWRHIQGLHRVLRRDCIQVLARGSDIGSMSFGLSRNIHRTS